MYLSGDLIDDVTGCSVFFLSQSDLEKRLLVIGGGDFPWRVSSAGPVIPLGPLLAAIHIIS